MQILAIGGSGHDYSFCYLIINKMMLDLTAFRLEFANLKTLKLQS